MTVPVTKHKHMANAKPGEGGRAVRQRAARPRACRAPLILLFLATHPKILTAFAVHPPSPDAPSHPFCPSRNAWRHVQPTLLPADGHAGEQSVFQGCLCRYCRQSGAVGGWSWGWGGWSRGYGGDGEPRPCGSSMRAGGRGRSAVALRRLRASGGSSPWLRPAPVVNVLITVLMSCKWNPTSKYIRVMSSHLTNGDLIELLIGCLFPPRFMTSRAGAARGGRGGRPRSAHAPARPPASWPGSQFPGTSSLHLSARKNKQFEAPVSLLNISFKLHTLAPCPNAPRKLPQSSSSPELHCGLPGVNNPRRSEHLRRRLRPKPSPGLPAPPGPPGEADAAGRTPRTDGTRQRPWGGERRRRGTGGAVCLAPLSGTQTRRGSEVGGEAAALRRRGSPSATGLEALRRRCKGGWEAALAGEQKRPYV